LRASVASSMPVPRPVTSAASSRAARRSAPPRRSCWRCPCHR
jgi:hypothetical protein